MGREVMKGRLKLKRLIFGQSRLIEKSTNVKLKETLEHFET
jgi:hypothetical protein